MIFFNTDGHTNSIQNESPHYPIWAQVEIFYTQFFYLSQKRVSEQSKLTPFFWTKQYIGTILQ